MPSRLSITAILAFWLAMTGWLIEREVVPLLFAEVSPSHQISLIDEIRSPPVGWTAFQAGKRIGSVTSRIHANDDDSYEFRSIFHFDQFVLAEAFGQKVMINQMEMMDRVSEKGRLQAFSAKVAVSLGRKKLVAEPDIVLELGGDVVNDLLKPRGFYNGEEQKIMDLGTIDVSKQASVLNPMCLVSRLRGLRAGQSWKVTLFDPLQGMTNQFIAGIAKQGMTIPALIAEVKVDSLLWNHQQIVCYKIEYHEPDKEVVARTWVRKNNGLVLQQEAAQYGFELVLVRNPD